MDRHTAKILTGLGVDASEFRTTVFDRELAEESDLILTMTRRHRTTALALAPRAMRRTFTLPEAADLVGRADLGGLDQVPLAARGAEFAARLHAGRAQRPVAKTDDVPDPIGRRSGVHRSVARRIAQALDPIGYALFTGGSGAAPEPNFVVAEDSEPAGAPASRPATGRTTDPHPSIRRDGQRGATRSPEARR
jgi:protein-tyrosine phosphatase